MAATNPPATTTIAANVRAAQEAAGVSRAELAAALEITPAALSHKLLGRRRFTAAEVAAVAAALDVDPGALLITPTTPQARIA